MAKFKVSLLSSRTYRACLMYLGVRMQHLWQSPNRCGRMAFCGDAQLPSRAHGALSCFATSRLALVGVRLPRSVNVLSLMPAAPFQCRSSANGKILVLCPREGICACHSLSTRCWPDHSGRAALGHMAQNLMPASHGVAKMIGLKHFSRASSDQAFSSRNHLSD